MRSALQWVNAVTCGCCGVSPGDFNDLRDETRLQRRVTQMRVAGFVNPVNELEQVKDELNAERLLATSRLGPFTTAESGLIQRFSVQRHAVGNSQLAQARRNVTRVRGIVMARAVSAVLAVVDSKLGAHLEDTSENHLLVDRVARQAMVSVGFRTSDIAAHSPHVLECYFQCREHLRKAGGTRRRLPRWALSLMGFRAATTGRKI